METVVEMVTGRSTSAHMRCESQSYRRPQAAESRTIAARRPFEICCPFTVFTFALQSPRPVLPAPR